MFALTTLVASVISALSFLSVPLTAAPVDTTDASPQREAIVDRVDDVDRTDPPRDCRTHDSRRCHEPAPTDECTRRQANAAPQRCRLLHSDDGRDLCSRRQAHAAPERCRTLHNDDDTRAPAERTLDRAERATDRARRVGAVG